MRGMNWLNVESRGDFSVMVSVVAWWEYGSY